ncbi:MAG: hypothetical protein ACI86H_002064 [bacterium]|jgi:hypothetical protein
MSMFQNSVVKKYLANFEKGKVKKNYQGFLD